MLLKRKIIFIVSILILSTSILQAQLWKNFLNHDENSSFPFYFGLNFSYVNSSLNITKSPYFYQSDTVLSALAKNSSGFGIGLVAAYRISKRFQIRTTPQLVLGSGYSFSYTVRNGPPGSNLPPITVDQTQPTISVSFPVEIKFSSDRIKNFRMYMFTGVNNSIDFSNNRVSISQNALRFKPYNFSLTGGFGANFYLPYVTISPEVRFGYGLTNIHQHDPTVIFSQVLDQITIRTVSFSILLED